jgi:hypothetical protein
MYRYATSASPDGDGALPDLAIVPRQIHIDTKAGAR